MDKTLGVINEITRRGIIKAYAIGGGIAATYYIEPTLTYDLDIFFIPATEGSDIRYPGDFRPGGEIQDLRGPIP